MTLKTSRAPRAPQMLLLALLAMTSGCGGFCSKQTPKSESVVVVNDNDIVENPDGSFTVSKGWMLNRMHLENELESALEACLNGDL